MTSKSGILETEEAIAGVFELAILIVDKLKDGFQFRDIPDILQELAKDERFLDAVRGVQKIPSELSDLNTEETFRLMQNILGYTPRILIALRKN